MAILDRGLSFMIDFIKRLNELLQWYAKEGSVSSGLIRKLAMRKRNI